MNFKPGLLTFVIRDISVLFENSLNPVYSLCVRVRKNDSVETLAEFSPSFVVSVLRQILTREFCCYAYFSLIIFLKNS